VPVQYKKQIEAIIAYQNTQQSADNGEFIAAIECAFSFSSDDDVTDYDTLLVTIQESTYKRIAKQLFDTDTLLNLLLDTTNPVEDDNLYIGTAIERQNLGNIWFNRDWLLHVPFVVHWAAAAICNQYDGFILTHINVEENVFIAWYNDTSLEPEDDGYLMFREFTFADGKVIDTYI
jgi:hypothetical protein